MPNAQSRRLFAALLPLIAARRAETLYPDVLQTQPETPSETISVLPEVSGALFRYRNRDLWCVAHSGSRFDIAFPDQTRWTVQPIEE